MPRFVILLHQTPQGSEQPDHVDLMLERGESLRTWRLEKMPAAGEEVVAERIADHRLAYLDYEGEVSGGRGRVTRVDAGEFESVQENPIGIRVRLKGTKLNGMLTLDDADGGGQRWRASFFLESGASSRRGC
jgi:hypothetical protein